MGAIFCRECGGKLDLNELKPEDFQKMGVPSSKKIIKRVKEWANSLMTLALIVFVVLVSWPPANTIARPEAPEEEQTAKLERKFKAVTNATRAMRFKFTPEEINYLTNTVYGFDPEKAKRQGHSWKNTWSWDPSQKQTSPSPSELTCSHKSQPLPPLHSVWKKIPI